MLEEKIYQDYVVALKAHDKPRTNFLSFVRAELKNEALNLKKTGLEDAQVLSILKKQQKRLREAKESAGAQRPDFVREIENELSILESYLPSALSDLELASVIAAVVTETGASSLKDMGKVMKEVLARVGARADSGAVSSLVRQKLSAL